MDLPVERIPTLVAGAGTLLLGITVVAMSPRSPLHRAFGLFCGLRGGMLALQAFSRPIDDLAGRSSVYLLLAIPFAAVWLAHSFVRRDRRLRPVDVRLAGLLLAGAFVVEALYLYDHGLFYDGWLSVFFVLQFASYAAIGLAILALYLRQPSGPARRALYPLALAFAAEPAFWLSYNIYDELTPSTATPLQLAEASLVVAAAVVIVATAVLAARLRRTPSDRHDRWRFLAVQAIAVTMGAATYLDVRHGLMPWDVFYLFYLNAAWTLFLVAMAAYAIVKYQLFTIDLRVKAFIRHGATAVLEGGIFVVVSELLEDRLASDGLVSLLAALVIAAVLFPVSRLTRRMAERLMPGVADVDEYRAKRRLDIYRAALYQAWLDGQVTQDEKAALDALWKSLGIPGRDARLVEQEMRTPRTSA